MKISLFVALPAILIFLLFAGCAKTDLQLQDSLSATIANNATSPDLSMCKIRRIYQRFDEDYVVNALFTYNKFGNPYSVVYSRGPGDDPLNYYFFYDTNNRLIEYQQRWGDEYVLQYHYFFYNQKGQIIKDSTIYADCCGNLPRENVSTIEYDLQGRVIRETIINIRNDEGPLEKIRRPTYTYDSRGNLAVNGWKSSSYDYKINPLRQNQIFQFIHRNYSMNNASVQPKYNSKGLPLTSLPSNDAFFNGVGMTKIIYDCQ